MSTHEGVSCDSCLKSNFRGRRYKCLICYDYDLCAACYEAGATNTRHTTDHPMQCILTRADYELYYGGEVLANPDQPQSYTCPFCARMGLTEATLYEHVTSEHADASCEVVCPICAGMPGGDPNLMTDDFAGHLTLEHRTGPRDLISFLDEPVAPRHSVRRAQNSTNLPRGGGAAQSSRARRTNMHFSVFSSGGLSSLSPSSRDPVDPIAELLSQLSGVRRSTSNTNTSTPTQLHQLQMQLQMERQQVNQARQQLERLPRRQNQSQMALRETTAGASSSSSSLLVGTTASNMALGASSANAQTVNNAQNQFLLSCVEAEEPSNEADEENEDYIREFVTSLVQYTMTLVNQQKGEDKEKEKDEELTMTKGDCENASAMVKANDSCSDVNGTYSADVNSGAFAPVASRDGRILRGRARSKSSNVGRRDTSKSKDLSENAEKARDSQFV